MNLRQRNLVVTNDNISGTLYWHFDENVPASTIVEAVVELRKANAVDLKNGVIVAKDSTPIFMNVNLTRKNLSKADEFDFNIQDRYIFSEKEDGRVTINFLHKSGNVLFFNSEIVSDDPNILRRMLDLYVSEILFKLYHIYSVEPFNKGLQRDIPNDGPAIAIKNNFDFH